MGSCSKVGNSSYDYSFKILLIGDSGVGKSTILLSFISNSVHDLSPTIGVDFKIKLLTVGGKRLKLTIWDTEWENDDRSLRFLPDDSVIDKPSCSHTIHCYWQYASETDGFFNDSFLFEIIFCNVDSAAWLVGHKDEHVLAYSEEGILAYDVKKFNGIV